MTVELNATEALDLWRHVIVQSVRGTGPDLSARQMAIVLTVYLTPPPHTVRGLSALLDVSKPAVTRALDRLGMLGLARRKRDSADKRNVLVQRTVKGSAFLADFAAAVAAAGQRLGERPCFTPSALEHAAPPSARSGGSVAPPLVYAVEERTPLVEPA
jgi:DNA-binding MarR family transcriptional regulator